MSTSEKCKNCDGTPLQTGKCNPMACTVSFSIKLMPTNVVSVKDYPRAFTIQTDKDGNIIYFHKSSFPTVTFKEAES